MMEKEMLGHTFKYENDKLYRWHKRSKRWDCCDGLKVNKSGYIQLTRPKMYLHRLVYYFHNPEWDINDSSRDNQIDHINQIKTDNRIENLRVVNSTQNCQNKTHRDGKEIKGVNYHITRKKWQAYWQENGKTKTKSFATEEEALAHRAEMVRIHYTHAPTQSGE